MFVLGLLVGPAIGLVAGDAIFRSRAFDPRLGAVVLGLLLIFILFAGFFALALKVSLIAGILLGLLLAATPGTAEA